MDMLKFMVTLWPSFPHFPKFAFDNTLAGIRLNSAMIETADLAKELAIVKELGPTTPLYFDVKGRQLRVDKVIPDKYHLDLTLNHPIKVDLPQTVFFKAGEDAAELIELDDDGRRLIFQTGCGPQYDVRQGESLHILHPSLQVLPPNFGDAELSRVEQALAAGFKRFFLSYVDGPEYVEEFLEIVGHDAEVYLKIESIPGLRYVANDFVKKDNLVLVAACGDMFIEIEQPHQILSALKLIIEKDPQACVGSRMLLSLAKDARARLGSTVRALARNPEATLEEFRQRVDAFNRGDFNYDIPSLADLQQLGWLYEIGYRNMMLCDEICLEDRLLTPAMNVMEAFREDYVRKSWKSQHQWDRPKPKPVPLVSSQKPPVTDWGTYTGKGPNYPLFRRFRRKKK